MRIRKPAVSGMFYESNPGKLEKEVRRYLDEADVTPVQGNIIALISPHAGYMYSGRTAACGYSILKDKDIRRVFILAPSHCIGFRGASIPDVDVYETPLGKVVLDKKTCADLLKRKHFTSIAQAHSREHSLEVQIPFLQVVLKRDFLLVPIVIGQIQDEDYPQIAGALNEFLKDGDLVVISSDFIHQGPRFGYMPAKKNIRENIEKIDMKAIDLILKKDGPSFIEYVDSTGATICGKCPIGILLYMLPDDAEGFLLKYCTSGDVTGDERETVSYASIAFVSGKGFAGEDEDSALSEKKDFLNREEKKILLDLAKKTIEECVKGRKISGTEDYGKVSGRLKEKSGVFVTLTKKGRLRGCIGYIEPVEPLYKAVMNMAVNASTRDFRFNPVTEDELNDIEIEISVLTPPEKVSGPGEFAPGEHGIIIKKGPNQAVFLPQVAPEQGWDRETTLNHLCVKAGLPAGEWKKSGMEFYVFEAVVFSEEDLK
ncbi:MAG: AmmeMemoRadiSam system protein B [bacterium]|nr:AmmeMemoRadiSam system protein B [bacterium]